MHLFTLPNRNVKSIGLIIWMAAAPLVFTGLLTYYLQEYQATVLNFSSFDWAFFFILTIFSMAFALTPTTAISIIVGYFIGFWGILPMAVCYTLASLLGFFLSKFFNDKFIVHFKRVYPAANRYIATIQKGDQFWFVFFCRISPVLPFGIMNVLLSYLGIRLSSFVVGGLIGMLPRTLVAILAGKFSHDLIKMLRHPVENSNTQFTFILLLFLSSIGLYIYFKKRMSGAHSLK